MAQSWPPVGLSPHQGPPFFPPVGHSQLLNRPVVSGFGGSRELPGDSLGTPFGTPAESTAWSRACCGRACAAVGAQRSVPCAGHGAGLTQGSSQGHWGCAYQALANPPCLCGLGQVLQLPPLQELAGAAEGFPGSLVSSRDVATESQDPVSPLLAGLRASPGPCREDTAAGCWSDAATGFSTPGGDSSVSEAEEAMSGAVWRELGGKETHLPIYLGSRRGKAAVGREGGSAWS